METIQAPKNQSHLKTDEPIQRLRILDYYKPYGEKTLNPRWPEIEEALRKKLKEMVAGLDAQWFTPRELDAFNCQNSYVFPEADFDVMIALGMYTNLLYIHDDISDHLTTPKLPNEDPDLTYWRENYKDIHRMNGSIFLTGKIPSHARDSPIFLHQEYLKLFQEFSKRTSPAWMKRFGVTVTLFSLANGKSQKATYHTLEDYINHREDDAGVKILLDLIEMAGGFILTEEESTHPAVLAMRKNVARIGSLLNDVCSYEKEVREGTYCNLLMVMMRKDPSLTPQEAAIATLKIISDEQNQFWENAKNLPDTPNLQKWFRSIKFVLSGCWYFQASTNRYRSENSMFEELNGFL